MTHKLPIVDFVMRTGDRTWAYVLPPIEECRVLYATDVRVRILRANGAQESVDKGRLVCIGSAADWTAVTDLYQAFQHTLDDLAKLLASFGRYPTVLHELEATRHAAVAAAKQTAARTGLRTRPVPAIPNPLTPTVIACPDPLATTAHPWPLPGTNWDLPSVRRTPAARHTKVMLAVGTGILPRMCSVSSRATPCVPRMMPGSACSMRWREPPRLARPSLGSLSTG